MPRQRPPRITSGSALDLARPAGRPSWELRAATSLARLLRDQGRSAEALVLLHRSTTGSPKGSDGRPASREGSSDALHT